MSISLVSDQKIAETSSKGNQEKWYDAGTDSWYKLDQFGYEALAETISQVAIEVQDRVSRDIDRQELESFYKTLRTLSVNFENLARELAQGEK